MVMISKAPRHVRSLFQKHIAMRCGLQCIQVGNILDSRGITFDYKVEKQARFQMECKVIEEEKVEDDDERVIYSITQKSKMFMFLITLRQSLVAMRMRMLPMSWLVQVWTSIGLSLRSFLHSLDCCKTRYCQYSC